MCTYINCEDGYTRTADTSPYRTSKVERAGASAKVKERKKKKHSSSDRQRVRVFNVVVAYIVIAALLLYCRCSLLLRLGVLCLFYKVVERMGRGVAMMGESTKFPLSEDMIVFLLLLHTERTWSSYATLSSHRIWWSETVMASGNAKSQNVEYWIQTQLWRIYCCSQTTVLILYLLEEKNRSASAVITKFNELCVAYVLSPVSLVIRWGTFCW